MENSDPNHHNESRETPWGDSVVFVTQVVSEPPIEAQAPMRYVRRRVGLPILLFVLTCISTVLVQTPADAVYLGWIFALRGELVQAMPLWISALKYGLWYAGPLMTILLCHEAGHFFQARRYRVYASLPYFIPMPISPIGTLGAVIGMQANVGDRKALFDIGITGPLAGLLPTLAFSILGLQGSHVVELARMPRAGLMLGEPLLFKWLVYWTFGPLPAGYTVNLGPMAFAGWVGLLITALNLFPIGQLDGGHILYGLLRTKAHRVASLLLWAAILAMIVFGYWGWMIMIVLLLMMGPKHPPTADDNMPLGAVRIILGWLTLAFVSIGFTPVPIV